MLTSMGLCSFMAALCSFWLKVHWAVQMCFVSDNEINYMYHCNNCQVLHHTTTALNPSTSSCTTLFNFTVILSVCPYESVRTYKLYLSHPSAFTLSLTWETKTREKWQTHSPLFLLYAVAKRTWNSSSALLIFGVLMQNPTQMKLRSWTCCWWTKMLVCMP